MSEVVGTIGSIKPLNCSASGNPRFRVTLTDGRVFDTVPDYAINYGIQNPEFRGVPVHFEITRAGNIHDAWPVGGVSAVVES